MEILFDTADLKLIQKYAEVFDYSGVTTNPALVRRIGKVDFFQHFKSIRNFIGMQKNLHVQVTAHDATTILNESEAILKNIDEKTFIKIPVTCEGLKAIKVLKKDGVGITATTVVTKTQALLALNAGADFIAPYYTQMKNNDVDADKFIESLRILIDNGGYSTKIVSANIINIAQFNRVFECNSHAVTLNPSLLEEALAMPQIEKSIKFFDDAWQEIYGENCSICNFK